MNITQKILILLSSVFMLLSAAGYLVQYYSIMPIFTELEHWQAKTNIHRVENALDNNLRNLDNITLDWASWDDSYNFALGKNNHFLENNLTDKTFNDLKLNLILFLDLDKKSLGGKAYDLQRQQPMADNKFIDNLAAELAVLTLFPVADGKMAKQGTRNIYIYNNAPILIAIRKIFPTSQSSEPSGYLIFGQFLNQTMLDTIKKQIDVNFTIELDNNIPVTSEYSVKTINAEQIQISTYLAGLNQAQSLKIIVNTSREISKNGLVSLNYALFSLVMELLTMVVIIGLLLRNIIIKPIGEFSKKIATILENSNYSLRINSNRKDEIGQLEQQFNALLAQIESDQQQLIHLASTDKLTQLSNRLELEKVLETEWLQLQRKQLPLSIIMFDLDFFKLYNDCYGHQLGDECLKSVAKILKQSLQRPADLAARYGGEEFILVLPDTTQEGAVGIAARIKQQLALEQISHQQSTVSQWVTASMGIATVIPTPKEDYASLISKADKALYFAKNQGRNQSCVYHQDLG